MTDQAHTLRTLVNSAGTAAEAADGELPLVVITGARAGVGVTTVSLNLAAVLTDRGKRVLLVDGSQHSGESHSPIRPRTEVKYSLADVIGGTCELDDAIVDGPAGVAMLLSGRVSSSRGATNWREATTRVDVSRRAQDRLLSELTSISKEFDIIVVDAGRGLTPWSRRFWLRSQLSVLVTTADDEAVLDAYAMLKESAAEAVGLPVRLLVNRADSDFSAVNVHRRLESACRRFLSQSIPALPALPRHFASEFVGASMPPRVWEMPNTPFGHAAMWLGRAVSELVGIEDAACSMPSLKTPAFPDACIWHPAY
jgi:flagellar biosynthesis protein FlhG